MIKTQRLNTVIVMGRRREGSSICRNETFGQPGRDVHAVDVAGLAAVADALMADGRNDLAAQIILVMYYCAERQAQCDNDFDSIVPLHIDAT